MMGLGRQAVWQPSTNGQIDFCIVFSADAQLTCGVLSWLNFGLGTRRGDFEVRSIILLLYFGLSIFRRVLENQRERTNTTHA